MLCAARSSVALCLAMAFACACGLAAASPALRSRFDFQERLTLCVLRHGTSFAAFPTTAQVLRPSLQALRVNTGMSLHSTKVPTTTAWCRACTRALHVQSSVRLCRSVQRKGDRNEVQTPCCFGSTILANAISVAATSQIQGEAAKVNCSFQTGTRVSQPWYFYVDARPLMQRHTHTPGLQAPLKLRVK